MIAFVKNLLKAEILSLRRLGTSRRDSSASDRLARLLRKVRPPAGPSGSPLARKSLSQKNVPGGRRAEDDVG